MSFILYMRKTKIVFHIKIKTSLTIKLYSDYVKLSAKIHVDSVLQFWVPQGEKNPF